MATAMTVQDVTPADEAPAEFGETARRARGFNVRWKDYQATASQVVEQIFEMAAYLAESREAIIAKGDNWLDMFDPAKVVEPITFGGLSQRSAQDKAGRLLVI